MCTHAYYSTGPPSSGPDLQSDKQEHCPHVCQCFEHYQSTFSPQNQLAALMEEDLAAVCYSTPAEINKREVADSQEGQNSMASPGHGLGDDDDGGVCTWMVLA